MTPHGPEAAPLSALDALVERRIGEAMRAGIFDDLPGAGRPLAFDDDALVPAELRMAYRMLKNAGFVPPEMEARREIADLERLAATAQDDAARRRAAARIAFLLERSAGAGRARNLALEADYFEGLAARLAR